MSTPNDTGDNKEADKSFVFPVGGAAKRELKKSLRKAASDPQGTIQAFQESHSLHFMLSKAFGTVSIPEAQREKATRSKRDKRINVESLDSDSVMIFLSHLGVSQHEVHKRISDTMLKQLEDEIRKTKNKEPLLALLLDSWPYVVRLPELRPIIWSLLKQLGENTPPEMLHALAERAEAPKDTKEEGGGGPAKNKLKHADIFRPLPALLKKLVWEADWTTRFPVEPDVPPSVYLKQCESTLLYETMYPLVEQYCNNAMLVESSNRPFVPSNRERRMVTTQRRALTTAASSNTTPSEKSSGTAALLGGKTSGGANDAAQQQDSKSAVSSSKAIAQLRVYLSDGGGGSSALSYRPKMLYALLSIIIARHGALIKDKKKKHQPAFLGGAKHLHCTLVSDILLSAGGPLPKAYHHVHQLARIVDECVHNGNISNDAIKSIQTTLSEIFLPDQDGDGAASTTPSKKTNEKSSDNGPNYEANRADTMTNALQRQLNHIITAGIVALKESDPQNLFLNPVTNKIAPGYSKIIKRPMCILTMEQKINDNNYKTVDEWEVDVKLMFKNCIDYNRGESGQWFRGEAERQSRVFREEIFPQAHRLYQTEIAKRKTEEMERKRKVVSDVPDLVPLEKSTKKRRKDTATGGSKQEQELVPSMPALAFLILSDPFLIRIILARVLREVRVSISGGSTIPASSFVIPSLLQLLHMSRWSSQICAIRAKRYFIPSGGMSMESEEEQQQDPAVFAPYATLRQDIPLLLRLLLEAELDKRVVLGGDLHEAAQSQASLAPEPIVFDEWVHGNHLEVPVALVQAALVHISQPGNSTDAALVVTFPKFTKALAHVSSGVKSEDGDDRIFFQCLIRAIVRHKAKLSKPSRDAVVNAWVNDWLSSFSKRGSEEEAKSSLGTMTSAAHECYIMLLNEWSSIGNQILPRDTLLDFVSKGVKATDESESKEGRRFVALWTTTEKAKATAFEPVKKQYLKMLSNLPAANATQWRNEMGISSSDGEPAVGSTSSNDSAKVESKEKKNDSAIMDATMDTSE